VRLRLGRQRGRGSIANARLGDHEYDDGSRHSSRRASRVTSMPIEIAASVATGPPASGWSTTSATAARIAEVAYKVLPPKTDGVLRSTMSRSMPPPTAVIVPSSPPAASRALR
jgi:hypothetical protein